MTPAPCDCTNTRALMVELGAARAAAAHGDPAHVETPAETLLHLDDEERVFCPALRLYGLSWMARTIELDHRAMRPILLAGRPVPRAWFAAHARFEEAAARELRARMRAYESSSQ